MSSKENLKVATSFHITKERMLESELDILSIDAKIQHHFEKERDRLAIYRDRLSDLEKTAENNGLSWKSRIDIGKNIAELRETVQRIESNRELNFYIIETAEIVQKYKQILKTPIKMSFVGRPKTNCQEKQQLVRQYVAIAQKYCSITANLPKQKNRVHCDNCPNKKDFIIEENTQICVECGAQQEIMQYTSSYRDIDRVNISSKYTYDRKVHFRDCINQYQGKQNCTIDQKVYEDLEDMFQRHHLLVGDNKTKRDVRFNNITKEHVLMFLKELKHSKHYENVTLIHYTLTGKKPDDISHLEDKLLNDFDLLVETYDKHFKHKVDRVNFISTQYVLYQLLQRHRHSCKKEDFVILKTVDRKSFHDNIYRELAARLGWNYVPLF